MLSLTKLPQQLKVLAERKVPNDQTFTTYIHFRCFANRILQPTFEYLKAVNQLFCCNDTTEEKINHDSKYNLSETQAYTNTDERY